MRQGDADVPLSCRTRSQQSNPSREQLLHHALLDFAGFGELPFQHGDLRIHVEKNSGEGDLFFESRWRTVDKTHKVLLIQVIDCRARTKLIQKFSEDTGTEEVEPHSIKWTPRPND